MISVASRDICFWKIKSECYIAFKNYSYATAFPINLIDFVKNYILSGSHYNCSEAVQTGNKCVFFFIVEGKVKIKKFWSREKPNSFNQ